RKRAGRRGGRPARRGFTPQGGRRARDAYPPGASPRVRRRLRDCFGTTHRGDPARDPPTRVLGARAWWCGRRGGVVSHDLPVDEALARAATAIRSVESVGLACHVSPDGDALGSMLALHHALTAAGVHSIASFSEPFVVAPHYRQLPGLELLTPP